MLRHAAVTIFNNSLDIVKTLSCDDRIQYVIAQEEVCPSTGRDHLQCYVQFKRPVKFTTFRRLLPQEAHITKPNGTAEENRHYCGKPWPECKCKHCDGPGGRKSNCETFESGVFITQGYRSDLHEFQAAIESGKSEAEIAKEQFSTWAKYPGLFKRYTALMAKDRTRDDPPEVTCYVGPTGVGKTRRVFDEHKDDVYIKDETKWWDGYTGQTCILLDEFTSSTYWTIQTLLRFLDRYPFQGEIKGGHVKINSPHIAITSNLEIEKWFPYCDSAELDALKRRITNTVHL